MTKNPRSRYHTEQYEIHLAKIEIPTLKHKWVFNEIQNWKDNFRLSQHREATEADLKESIQIAPQRKQLRTASELLELWNIHNSKSKAEFFFPLSMYH